MRFSGFLAEKYRRLMQSDMENIIYWWSIAVVLCVAAMYAAVFLLMDILGIDRACGFYSMFGIPCPGCGGTRALANLLHGRIWTAVRYNAFAVYCCLMYGVYFLTNTFNRLSGGRFPAMRFRELYMYAGLVILIVQYVYKVYNFCRTGYLI